MKKSEDLMRESLDELKKEREGEDRHVASYAKRVKQWWNSRLHGTARKAEIEGPDRVLCVVTLRETGAVVVRAVGFKTGKRSAHGAARAMATSMLFDRVGKRLGNLDAYEFTYSKVEG